LGEAVQLRAAIFINQLRIRSASGNPTKLRASRPEPPYYALIPRMIPLRSWLLLFVASALLEGVVAAQDNAGGAAPATGGAAGGDAGTSSPAPGTPGGASSSFAQPSSPAVPATPATGATGSGLGPAPATPGGAASTLPAGTTTEQGTNAAQATGAGSSASSFGSPDSSGGSQLREAPTTFNVPGFYGRGSQQFTVGEGRLARPKFRFTGNLSVGYDDNVFTTPTHPFSSPEQTVEVLVAPAQPASSRLVVVPSGDPNVPDSVQAEIIPATKPKFKAEHIPAVPAAQRIGTFVTRTDAKWDIQMASRRQLFTFDLGAGVDYYWDRPGKKEDYTGNLSMVYLRKLTGRAQFTFAVDMSYQSQPDFSQPNLPSSNRVGSYLNTNFKADLAYRLTPRFSTTTSLAYNTLTYVDGTGSDYATTTFGTELRYLFSPRLTLLGELRYASDAHANEPAADTKTAYGLFGGELTLSRRFMASLRVGEAVQKFKQGGSSQSAPHVEATVNYKLGQTTTVSWNGRYGFEEAGAPNSTNLVARSGLQLTQIFSPRLQATLAVNLVHTDVKSTTTVSSSTPATSSSSNSSTTGTNSTTGTTTSTGTASSTSGTRSSSNSTSISTSSLTVEDIQDTIDATLGLYYTLDRHWSFNLSYTYTTVMGPVSTADYYHQRLFLGASYQF